MLRGYVDGIASSGYIEGWALNSEAPLDPLTIAILDDKGGELGWGLAHHYREDLSAAGLAAGWCGFRVTSAVAVGRLKQRALTLVDRTSGAEIVRRYPVPYAQDPDAVLSTIPEIVAADPTMTPSIFQLKGCDELLTVFLQQRGVDTYVAAAYAYVLGRAADPSGLASYGNLIRENTLTPFQLLAILSDSDEFRSRPRLLAAPNSAGFPFR
jgi:Domain of unknown function (DUF4214)